VVALVLGVAFRAERVGMMAVIAANGRNAALHVLADLEG
jgi:hypothetical protein